MAATRCRAPLRRPVLLLLALAACSSAFLAPAPLRRLPAPTTTTARRRSSLVIASTTPMPKAEAAAPGPKLVFKGLRSESFRHPLDQQATEQLRRLPGLEWVVRRLMRVAEEAVYLDNISSALLVGPRQMPALHASLLEACRILDLEAVPQLYVRQSPVANAYTMAVVSDDRRPFIVVNSCLLDLLTPAELQAVLAHEVAHIKCEHGVWITAANALALGLYSIGGSLGRALGDRIQGLLFEWLRAAEFSCDRGALLVTQDLHVVSSALLKLVGGSQSQAQAGQLSVDAFLQQARDYDRAATTPIGRLLRRQMEGSLTHPLPVMRVRELDRWFRGNAYKAIASRGTPIARVAATAGATAAASSSS